MSKKALESLLIAIKQYDSLSSKVKATTGDPLGKIFRSGAEKAPYNFVFDKKTFHSQIRDMIRDPNGLNFQDLSNDKIERLADKAYNNVKKNLQSRGMKHSIVPPGSPLSGQEYYIIEGAENNHELVGRIINTAFGGTQASGAFFDFLLAELSSYNNIAYGRDDLNQPIFLDKHSGETLDLSELPNEVTFVLSFASSRADKYKGYGFDVGHIISNIKNAFQVICYNAIINFTDENLKNSLFNNKDAASSLSELRQKWNAILGNDVSKNLLYTHLKREGIVLAKTNFDNIMTGFLDQTIEFSRKLAAGEIQGHLTETTANTAAEVTRLAGTISQWVMAEYGKANVSAGSAIEQTVSEHLKTEGANAHAKLLNYLRLWLQGNTSIPGLPPATQLEGSPTIKDMAAREFRSSLEKGKYTTDNNTFSGRANIKGDSKVGRTKNTKTTVSKPSKQVKPFTATVPTIQLGKARNAAGKFVSLVNVVALINLKLAEQIRQNMGSPRLNYRTGRFAQSAQVLPASVDKDGAIRMPYTYLKKPYQTFEIGFSKGTPSRDPRVVISESIRELAIQQVTAKLRIVRV
jgi:hypothetical protein